jgi:hypothetical protein
MNTEINKSRNLSLVDYMIQLQLEYVCAKLRQRIYTREIDKNYWGGVAESKKINIENISERNMLPTMFLSEEIEQDCKQKIYIGKSFPMFLYRNEDQKKKQEKWDYYYYYKFGEDFRFEINGETFMGKLKGISNDFTKLTIFVQGEEMVVDSKKCFRIL